MEELIRMMHRGKYSCVIAKGEIKTFTRRGITDLYDLLNDNPAFMQDASVADKVIGKGAAALMIAGGVKEIYTDLISEPAFDLLQKSEIQVTFRSSVSYILNRSRTDWCPVEKICRQAESAEECLPLIRAFIDEMRIGRTEGRFRQEENAGQAG